MNKPDDGELKMILANQSPPIDLHRFEAARQFAAAWLPIVRESAGDIADYLLSNGPLIPKIIERSNELGLAMADDLLRRLKGES